MAAQLITVRDVVFREIAVTSRLTPASSFRGFDTGHGVDGVAIANLRFGARLIRNAPEAHLNIGPDVRNLRFTDAPDPSSGH
jgi:hypothetical protein